MTDILYFDMFSGISGDMCVGAFLDLGLKRKALQEVLDALPMADEFRIVVKRRTINGIRGTDFNVRAREGHHHRHFTDIRRMLEKAPLPPATARLAVEIFHNLAKAEGQVHGKKPAEVTFHEVGAVDSIVDIVAAAFAMEYFGFPDCFSSPLRFGTGTVNTQHGRLPVPVPAVLELARGLTCLFTHTPMELTTPTGAAIIRTLVSTPQTPLPEHSLEKTAYGCGKRENPDGPNMLRLILGRRDPEQDRIIELRTDIDDSTPETMGYLFEKLFEAGALDCTAAPLLMKKGRPGTRINVLSDAAHCDTIKQVLFTETTTFGLRETPVQRTKLPRKMLTVAVAGEKVACKIGYLKGKPVTIAPEFEDCRRIAASSGRPLKDIRAEALQKARLKLKHKKN